METGVRIVHQNTFAFFLTSTIKGGAGYILAGSRLCGKAALRMGCDGFGGTGPLDRVCNGVAVELDFFLDEQRETHTML